MQILTNNIYRDIMISPNYTLYDNSLGIALVLMLFFAFYFLLAKTPYKRIFGNYLMSRRLMAGALLALSANYSVHLFVAPRFLWKECNSLRYAQESFYRQITRL